MQFSDQLITILDDLCERFGIVIDWSQQNIIPYIEALAAKYIKYEICTSIAWCVIMLFVTSIFVITAVVACKKEYEELVVVGTVFSVLLVMCTVLTIGCQTFDIIECCVIPEKTLLEFCSELLRQN